jgi:hypothetical protein
MLPSAGTELSQKFERPVRLLGFPHLSSVESADVAKTLSAFSAKAARGGRPGQAGRGPGARGERDAVARARYFFVAARSRSSTRAARLPSPELCWWYNCKIFYKMLERVTAWH